MNKKVGHGKCILSSDKEENRAPVKQPWNVLSESFHKENDVSDDDAVSSQRAGVGKDEGVCDGLAGHGIAGLDRLG